MGGLTPGIGETVTSLLSRPIVAHLLLVRLITLFYFVCVCVFLQMTLQQICADVNRVKSWGQQAYLDSNHKMSVLGKPATGKAVPHTPIQCITLTDFCCLCWRLCFREFITSGTNIHLHSRMTWIECGGQGQGHGGLTKYSYVIFERDILKISLRECLQIWHKHSIELKDVHQCKYFIIKITLYSSSTSAARSLKPWGQRSWRKPEANTRSLLSANQLCGQHHQVCGRNHACIISFQFTTRQST